MIEITYHPSFIKSFNKISKYYPFFQDRFREKIDIFKANPFDQRLKTHKLTGKLKDFYSFSYDYEYRVVFRFYELNKVVFVNIGSHEDVY